MAKKAYTIFFFVFIYIFLVGCSAPSKNISETEKIISAQSQNTKQPSSSNALDTETDLTPKTQAPAANIKKPTFQPELQNNIEEEISKTFKDSYSSLYEISDFNYQFKETKTNNENQEITFFLTMKFYNLDRNPDSVEYIANVKESDPAAYKILCEDYLAEQTMTFDMLAVCSLNSVSNFKFYTDISSLGKPVYMPIELFFPNTTDNLFIPYDSEEKLCTIKSIDSNSVTVDIYSCQTPYDELATNGIDEDTKLQLTDSEITIPINGYIQIDDSDSKDKSHLFHNLEEFKTEFLQEQDNSYYLLYLLNGDVFVIKKVSKIQ